VTRLIRALFVVGAIVASLGLAEPEHHPVTATVITEHASILFELEEGWHIYAKEPGDAGLPTKVAWSAPEGIVLGALEWPAPQTFAESGDIKTYGYTGAVVLASTLTTPMDAATAITLQAKVTWLACKEICLPGSAALELTLPVRAEAPQASPDAAHFAPAA
jgi:thiol:disulfide interchange protein DsbD